MPIADIAVLAVGRDITWCLRLCYYTTQDGRAYEICNNAFQDGRGHIVWRLPEIRSHAWWSGMFSIALEDMV
ncbi:hypothetical protein C2W62_03850 [Candidatus Entotheonella serta]|nr:hypothetical protein C2W62_03850 [Candidatus Entotheonella serta]